MVQTQGVLDYAPPASRNIRRVAVIVAGLIAFVFLGVVVGACVGHFIAKPFYSSHALLEVSNSGTNGVTLAVLTQSQMQTIIKDALAVARRDPLGKSLPDLTTVVLRASIVSGISSPVVLIDFEDHDPAAAACMVREMVKAYVSVESKGAASVLPITEIEGPVSAPRFRNAGYGVGGLIGGIAAIVLAMCWGWIRRRGRDLGV